MWIEAKNEYGHESLIRESEIASVEYAPSSAHTHAIVLKGSGHKLYIRSSNIMQLLKDIAMETTHPEIIKYMGESKE